ncbi:MFS general substrate transporter, partial [Thermothelomyces heterothallicus CBS 203.75]
MSSAEEPLISRREADRLVHDDNNHHDHDHDHDHDNDNLENIHNDREAYEHDGAATSSTLFIYLLTFSAGISGLLFGYDTGVISSTLVSLGTSLSSRPLTALDKSVITSATSLLALLISPFSSVLADRLGRKRVVLGADALFAFGALVQAASHSVALMVFGRAVVGMAVGAASFVVPLYLAELSPAAIRGRLVTMNVIFITLGQVAAYVIGWLLGEYGEEGTAWRWMVGLGAVPAVVQAVVMAVMPETPRWLVMWGRVREARRVVEKVHGGKGPVVDATVKGIEVEVREESEARRLRGGARNAGGTSWLPDAVAELVGVRRNRRALAIACLLQGLQQLCGFVSAPERPPGGVCWIPL